VYTSSRRGQTCERTTKERLKRLLLRPPQQQQQLVSQQKVAPCVLAQVDHKRPLKIRLLQVITQLNALIDAATHIVKVTERKKE
jgi:hypothetical protein